MKVVIADDNVVALKLLRNALLQLGHEVTSTSDGRQALDALNDGTCRLVIADWQMPEMDGLELCRAVRAAGLPGYVYFILLTGRNGQHDKLEALSAGVDDFIVKPFDRAELAARLLGAERLLSLETRVLTIFALAKLAESRDPETGSHLERVQKYTRLLARNWRRNHHTPARSREASSERSTKPVPCTTLGKWRSLIAYCSSQGVSTTSSSPS